MHTREHCNLEEESQEAAGIHYAALLNLIENAHGEGFKLDALLKLARQASAVDGISEATVAELIKQARRMLYQQMLDIEILDRDLADLHSEMLEKVEKPRENLQRLSLV